MGFEERGKGDSFREILGVKLEERGGFEGGFMVGVNDFDIVFLLEFLRVYCLVVGGRRDFMVEKNGVQSWGLQ